MDILRQMPFVIIGLDNGLFFVWHQAIGQTNAELIYKNTPRNYLKFQSKFTYFKQRYLKI